MQAYVILPSCQYIGLHTSQSEFCVCPVSDLTTINEKAKITTINGTILAVKEDFKYLVSYISSTEKDIRVRKAYAWKALHDLKNIWHCAMPDYLKRAIFMASVESILLYGSEAWTLTAVQEARLDGCYTSMLRMVFNVTWRDRVRNEVLYGGIP